VAGRGQVVRDAVPEPSVRRQAVHERNGWLSPS
jgi:hypothetical protein